MALHKLLAGLLVTVLGLPIVLIVLHVVARLLSAMQDPGGAVIVSRILLLGYVAWGLGLIALAIASAVAVLGLSLPRDEAEEPLE
jgi:hypothetical protein